MVNVSLIQKFLAREKTACLHCDKSQFVTSFLQFLSNTSELDLKSVLSNKTSYICSLMRVSIKNNNSNKQINKSPSYLA